MNTYPTDLINLVCDFAELQPEYTYKNKEIVNIEYFNVCKKCYQPIKVFKKNSHKKCDLIKECEENNLILFDKINSCQKDITKGINFINLGFGGRNTQMYQKMVCAFTKKKIKLESKIKKNIKTVSKYV